jgi:hypothetical protein
LGSAILDDHASRPVVVNRDVEIVGYVGGGYEPHRAREFERRFADDLGEFLAGFEDSGSHAQDVCRSCGSSLAAAHRKRATWRTARHNAWPTAAEAAFCGLRWGEAIALRVCDVDFLRRRILVSANAVQLGSTHHVGPTKDRRPRSVPVPEFILEDLSRRCLGKARDDLIFPAPGGGYLPRPHSGDGWFAVALRRATLPAITVHDLRHTCASLAVSAGVNVLALQRMLGHRSAKLTLDVYADLFDADLDDVATNLHTACAPESVGKVWARDA